jgi:ubiquinone/menaquinone biosynthesis C-methylase UbiE
MKNPWLKIPAIDYESHMAEVGQSRILGSLTRQTLRKYNPEKFLLPGCASGNGLEHVDNNVTSQVYALDINPEYLEFTVNRFQHRIPNLRTICCDLLTDKLELTDIDLAFCGLLLEYVDPHIALPKIIGTLNKQGNLVIVIQRNNSASFVSKTRYSSLEKLSGIVSDVLPEEIDNICRQIGMTKAFQEEIPVNDGKSFIVMDFSFRNKGG